MVTLAGFLIGVLEVCTDLTHAEAPCLALATERVRRYLSLARHFQCAARGYAKELGDHILIDEQLKPQEAWVYLGGGLLGKRYDTGVCNCGRLHMGLPLCCEFDFRRRGKSV